MELEHISHVELCHASRRRVSDGWLAFHPALEQALTAQGLAVTQDGRLATASTDTTVCLWE